MAEDFTAKFRVDISDLKKNITEANKEIKLANATFKASTAGMDDWTKDADGLSAKLKSLDSVLKSQKAVLASYKEQLDRQEQAYSENGARADQLRAKLQQLASQGVSKTDAEYQKYEKALAQVVKEQDKNANAADKLRIQILNQEAAIGKTEKETRQYTKALDSLDSEMNEAENEAKQYDKALENVADSSDKADRKSGQLAKTLAKGLAAGLVAVAVAAAKGVKELAKLSVQAAANADEILTQSKVTGMSTDSLQEYKYAANLVDVSLGTLTGAMSKNVKSMSNARQGLEKYANAYKALGVAVEDNGKLRNSESVFWDVIDALGEVNNETERDALAMQLFGKSARDLNPLIETGSAKLKEYGQEAHNMGAVLSEEALTNLGEFQDSLDRLKQVAEGAKNALGTVLVPELKMLADAGTELLGSFIKEIAAANGDWGKISEAIGNAAGMAAQKILEVAPKLIEAANSIISSLASVVIQNAPTLIQTGLKLAVDLIKQVGTTIINELPSLVTGIADIIKNGIPLINDAATSLFEGLVDALPSTIDRLTSVFPDLFTSIILAIANGISRITAQIPKIIQAIGRLIQKGIPAIAKAFQSLFKNLTNVIDVKNIAEVIPKIIKEMVSFISKGAVTLIKSFSQIGTGLATSLIKAIPTVAKAAVELIKGLITALPQIILEFSKLGFEIAVEIGRGLIEGAGEIFKSIVEVFTGVEERTKEASEAILKNNEAIYAHRQALEDIMPELADYNKLINENGETLSDLETKERTIEDAITQIIRDALQERGKLRDEDIKDIDEYLAQLAEVEAQKLEIIRTQQLAGLEALKNDSGVISQEAAAQYLATAQQTYADANAQAEAAYQIELTALTNKHKAAGTLNSEAYKNALTALRENRDKEIEINKGYLTETEQILTDSFARQSRAEAQKFARSKTELSEYASAHKAQFDTIQERQDAYVAELSKLDTGTANAFLNMAAKTKAEGGKVSSESLATAQEFLRPWKDLPEELDEVGIDSLLGMVQGMEEYIPQLANASEMTSQEIVDTIKEYLGIHSPSTVLAELGRFAVEGFAQGMEDSKASLDAVGAKIAASIVKSFGPKFTAALIKGVTGAKSGLMTAISSLFDGTGQIFAQKIEPIKISLQTAFTSISALLRGEGLKIKAQVDAFITAILTKITQGINQIRPKAVAALNNTVNALRDRRNDFYKIGEYLAEGLEKGYLSKQVEIRREFAEAARKAAQSVRDAVKVSSPSKVFAEIGYYMAEGLGVGFVGRMKAVNDQIRGTLLGYSINGSQGVGNSYSENVNNMNFTQNIYSPQPLTRYEIYRQTQNQLELFKRGV